MPSQSSHPSHLRMPQLPHLRNSRLRTTLRLRNRVRSQMQNLRRPDRSQRIHTARASPPQIPAVLHQPNPIHLPRRTLHRMINPNNINIQLNERSENYTKILPTSHPGSYPPPRDKPQVNKGRQTSLVLACVCYRWSIVLNQSASLQTRNGSSPLRVRENTFS